eukprot:gene10783-biopygen7836
MLSSGFSPFLPTQPVPRGAGHRRAVHGEQKFEDPIVQYMKTLLSILAKKEPLYITYLAGLQRLQAGEQLDQAVAMTVQDMRTLIQQFPNWTDKLVLRLVWMTASRWGEIESLTTAHFRELDIPSRIGLVDPPKDLQGAAKPPVSVPQVYREMRLQIRKLIHHLGPDQP